MQNDTSRGDLQRRPPEWMPLGTLGAVSVEGRDACGFLQAQLTCDLGTITESNVLPFAWCAPSGRTRHSGWLLSLGDAYLLLVDRDCVRALTEALKTYIMRAAVTLSDSEKGLAWRPAVSRVAQNADPGNPVRLWQIPGRELTLDAAGPLASPDDNGFRLAGIRSGTCELPPQLADRYLPQMLNLDLTGGLSFSKGCFPGQEVIARTHNLGKLKRRLMRFRADGMAGTAGTAVRVDEKEVGKVVVAASTDSGSELLAVVAIDAADRALFADATDRVRLHRLNLPYPVPELSRSA